MLGWTFHFFSKCLFWNTLMTTQQLIKEALQSAVCNLAHTCYPHLWQQLMGGRMIAFREKVQAPWIPLTSWQLTKQVLQSVIRDALEQTHLNLLVSETPEWGEDVTQHPHARGWERVSETQRCQKEERSKFIRSFLHYPRLWQATVWEAFIKRRRAHTD